MRKLSVAPLLILIAMFFWTRFGHAAPLPTSLPAKKKSVAAASSSAPRAKKPAPRRQVFIVDAAPGLPKTLPAKKKSVVNFDRPVLPETAPIAIREEVDALVREVDAEMIRRKEVTEAPRLEFVGPEQQGAVEIPNTATRTLRPALPDSDSFEISNSLPRTSPAVAAPVMPTFAAAPVVQPSIVIAQPTIVAEVPTVTVPIAAPVAVSAAPETPQAEPAQVTVLAETATEASTVSATTTAPESFGPPAPPLFDTSITESKLSTKSTDITEAEKALDADKGSSNPRPVELKASTTFLVPSNEIPRRRLFVRGGYLDAAYSKLESDLKNGATLFGVSASQVFSKTEVRLGLDFAYGLDQSIALRNTRMAMFRAEGLYNLANFADTASFYVGGALGLADIQVTSFRSKNSNGDVTVRENAKGTAFLGSPEIGSRLYLGRQVSVDLTLQYLLLLGGDQVSNLGGLLGELALGFRF